MRRLRLIAAVSIIGAAASAAGRPPRQAAAAATGPCDLFDADPATSCVAAHSLTRALYGAYAGPLYQVRRLSDNATTDIGVLDGVADGAAQADFCGLQDCVVDRIYDQSPHHNHLHVANAGGARRQLQSGPSATCAAALERACGVPKQSGNAQCVLCLEAANQTALAAACASCTPGPVTCATEWCGPDRPVNATRNPVSVGGRTVFSAYFEGSQGYRQDKTTGVATGDAAEVMYMVTSGTHFNDKCCFDCTSSLARLSCWHQAVSCYCARGSRCALAFADGNAETNNLDDDKGTMEAIYFGSGCGGGVGKGPWVQTDLENGCFGGNSTDHGKPWPGPSPENPHGGRWPQNTPWDGVEFVTVRSRLSQARLSACTCVCVCHLTAHTLTGL